jgi:ADP-ribosylglycohydrolase
MEMTQEFHMRARNALLGLAIGDAISWPAMYHRSHALPPWTRRIRREIDTRREEAGVLRVSMPFSLNQSPDAFDLMPTDDAEWAAWMMTNLLQHECRVEMRSVEESWRSLAQDSRPVRGWVSTKTALENLRKSIAPPMSGTDNPHYFDDGAICRTIPIGIACAGSPDEAMRQAAIEAAVTNAEDGIWVAQAAAAGISVGCAGGSIDEVVAAALAALPAKSWSRRTVEHAIALVNRDLSLLEQIPALHSIQNAEYSDGCVGPETLALALAVVSATRGAFQESLLGSLAFAKGADAVPSLVAALSGCLSSRNEIGSTWEQGLNRLRGLSIPAMAGCEYLNLVEQFIIECEKR